MVTAMNVDVAEFVGAELAKSRACLDAIEDHQYTAVLADITLAIVESLRGRRKSHVLRQRRLGGGLSAPRRGVGRPPELQPGTRRRYRADR